MWSDEGGLDLTESDNEQEGKYMNHSRTTTRKPRRNRTDIVRHTETTVHPTGNRRFLKRISNIELPPQVKSLVETYEHQVGVRDSFLWKWIYASVQPVTLSCVPADQRDAAATAKTLGAMFMVTLDDFAECTQDRNRVREATRAMTAADASAADCPVHDHVRFAHTAWDAFCDTIADTPRHDEFHPLLEFDMEQVIDGMAYSCLVNNYIATANLPEDFAHDSHTVFHYVNADVDLMFSPGFNRRDLGILRRILRPGQHLHRLMNWVCTWERELAEGDFTSGVFTLALERGVVDVKDLAEIRAGEHDVEEVRALIRTNNLEQQLRARWEQKYTDTLTTAFEAETESVDLVDYVVGVRHVCQNAMAKRRNGGDDGQ